VNSREKQPGCELELKDRDGGTVIRLRVKPRAGRDGVVGFHGGALRVSVNSAPEKGKANRAVLAVVAEALGLAPSQLRLLSGETSQDKQVWAPLDAATVKRKLSN
jgi:uncharacterized protein